MPRVLVLLSSLLLAACGGGGGAAGPGEPATLLLDFRPNAVHAGIYTAVDRGFDSAEGADLEIEVPGSSTDALKLLTAGETDFAVLDIHDLALAADRGQEGLVAVMAIVQRPLASVLAQPGIASPKELEGEKVGVSGLPSDVAVLRSIVEGDGGDPARVEDVTIGFRAVQALLSRRVAGATAFWNAEGVALRRERPGAKEFRVDDFGAPSYPELVLVTTRTMLDDRRGLVEATVRALQRGYVEVQTDPDTAVTTMASEVDGLDPGTLAAELDAVSPAFTAGAGFPGQLRRDVLEEFAAWEVEFGITKRPPDVGRLFDTSLARPISRD